MTVPIDFAVIDISCKGYHDQHCGSISISTELTSRVRISLMVLASDLPFIAAILYQYLLPITFANQFQLSRSIVPLIIFNED